MKPLLISRTLGVFLIALLSCATKVRTPSPEQLSSAQYGSAPAKLEVPEMIRRYLKASGYYDPNGSEIEACTDPIQGWVKNPNYDSREEFVFGWKVSCDINGKNRMGGFVGFETIQYFVKDGNVIAGNLPVGGQGSNLLFTPSNKFILWGGRQ